MFQPEHRVAAIQDTQHDRLAVHHGDDADPQVDLPPGHLQSDAAVLRQTLFRDVQMAQDLQSRHDRRLVLPHRARDLGLHQNAVNPIPNAELIFERLDVDVGCPNLQRLGHDLIHKLDDRRVLGGVGRAGEVQVVVMLFDDGDVVVRPERLQRIRPDTEELLGEPVNLGRGGQRRANIDARRQPQFVQAGVVEQAAGGDDDGVPIIPQRQQVVLQQQPRGEPREQFGGGGGRLDIGVRDAVVPGKRRSTFSSDTELTVRSASSSVAPPWSES